MSPLGGGQSEPMRLRTRIVVLVTSLACVGFLAMTGAGWLIVLKAEDEILNAFVAQTVPTHEDAGAAPSKAWLRVFSSAAELQAGTGLEVVPETEGWHEVFASDRELRALAVETWQERWRVWLTPGMEREFRLFVPPPSTALNYRWVDLTHFEFTESRTHGIFRAVLILATAVAILALFAGLLITRWTLRPVILLAERVRNKAPISARSTLAAGMADDEIGFLARTLDEARSREAEALARERRFIADCSHELRTPLATLRSALALWPDVDGEPEGRHRVLGRIERAVTRTEQLVRFFLVLAREEREPSHGGAVAIDAVVADLVEELMERTSGSRPTWTIHVPSEARVEASRDVLVCILHNLLDNALKHARPTRIAITWRDDGRLCIEDDGPGFPELQTIASPTVASLSAGYGLGLSLVERLCRVHGWSVTRATSVLGGARVEVLFSANRSATPLEQG